MKLSTKGRYGLWAMIDLAIYSETEPVSIQSIADRQNISERYLEQLMAKLKKAELVISTRGASGGYRLAKPVGDISVGDVLRALEGDLRAVTCDAQDGEGGCENADLCVSRYVWQKINASITNTVIPLSGSTGRREQKNQRKRTDADFGLLGQEAAEYEENNLYG